MSSSLIITKCRSCGAEIVFVRTRNGKSMPCNATPIKFKEDNDGKEKFVLGNGDVVIGVRVDDIHEATGIGMISHFATCPDAGKFRRKKI